MHPEGERGTHTWRYRSQTGQTGCPSTPSSAHARRRRSTLAPGRRTPRRTGRRDRWRAVCAASASAERQTRVTGLASVHLRRPCRSIQKALRAACGGHRCFRPQTGRARRRGGRTRLCRTARVASRPPPCTPGGRPRPTNLRTHMRHATAGGLVPPESGPRCRGRHAGALAPQRSSSRVSPVRESLDQKSHASRSTLGITTPREAGTHAPYCSGRPLNGSFVPTSPSCS